MGGSHGVERECWDRMEPQNTERRVCWHTEREWDYVEHKLNSAACVGAFENYNTSTCIHTHIHTGTHISIDSVLTSAFSRETRL